MTKHFCCPQCGNKDLQFKTETNVQTTGKNYSGIRGCLGYLLLGPLGLLCGLCGQGQKTTTTNTNYWVCPNCGKKFKNPTDLRESINSLHSTANTTPIILSVIGIITALLMIIRYAETDFITGLTAGITFGVIFAVCGLIIRIKNKSSASKLESELATLESSMNKFKND